MHNFFLNVHWSPRIFITFVSKKVDMFASSPEKIFSSAKNYSTTGDRADVAESFTGSRRNDVVGK